MQPEREQTKKKNLFKINLVLVVISRGHQALCNAWGQREGRGPLPSTTSDIHPLKKVESEAMEQIEIG